MGRGAAGPENLPAPVAGLAFRAKRTTASEPANKRPRYRRHRQLTRHHRHSQHSPEISRSYQGRGPCPQTPEIYRLRPIPESKNRNGTPQTIHGVPSPVLAPGTALGSRLRVALSSGQVLPVYPRHHRGTLPLRACPRSEHQIFHRMALDEHYSFREGPPMISPYQLNTRSSFPKSPRKGGWPLSSPRLLPEVRHNQRPP